MKTFNKTLILPLFITLILTGCMPDSLTKFKKDPPKKATADNISGPIIDDEGNVVNPSTFQDPAIFKYKNDATGVFVTESAPVIVEVGQPINLAAVIDGSLDRSSTDIKYAFVSCTIAPSLPPGVTINSSATAERCNITGRPADLSTTSLGAPKLYTVTLTFNSSTGYKLTKTATFSFGSYVKPVDFTYTQNDKMLLTVALNTGTLNTVTNNTNVDDTYVRSGFVTSESGVIGVVKFVDPDNNRIGVIKTVPIKVSSAALLGLVGNEFPGISTPKFISASGGKSGKVIRVVGTTLYVEMISSASFVAGDVLDDTKTFVSSTGATVTEVDDAYMFTKINNAMNIDNNIQFYTNRMTITAFSRAYEVGKTLGVDHPRLRLRSTEITNTYLTPANGVKFTVSPELPTGLSINENTGEITGAFTDIAEPASFTITASNLLSSSSAVVGISAIKSPKDLSYTTRQLIAVKSTSKFIEGETLYQPVTPPLNTSVVAKILRKYDSGVPGDGDNRYKLSIDTMNGSFLAGASLDSGNFFYSEKSFIPSTAIAPLSSTPSSTPVVVYYNTAITVASVSGFSIGGYVSTPQGAAGKIVAIEGTTLFIQSLTPGATPTFVSFQERNGGAANTLGNALTYAARTTQTTISQVEANVMELSLDSLAGSPDFSSGKDITSSGKLAAYIYEANLTAPASPVIRVSDITKRPETVPYFKSSQTIYDNEYENGANTANLLNAASLENVFVLDQGRYAEIKANLTEGNGLSFSISPALPTGLTLNTKTGQITGTPSVRTTLKDYVLTATNLMGKSQYTLQLEVRDYFKLSDGSGASTSIIHKYGSSKSTRGCRINASDILEEKGDLDVRCFMEIEEEELHSIKLNFRSSAGAGICEFIQVEPYSFYQWAPLTTPPTTKYAVTTGCATVADLPVSEQPYWVATPPSTETSCSGNYTAAGGPNCDSGSYTVTSYDGVVSGGTCIVTASSPTTTKCGGTQVNCLQGPVTDLLSTGELAKGYRSLVYATSSGLTISSQFSSPYSKLDLTNLRVANSTVNNACNFTNDDADAWEAMAAGTPATTSPFGESTPFYTFNCLDGSKDIKARIRVAVRDWNKSFKINSSIDFDLPGVAPLAADLMNNTASVFGKSNNDYADWDDSYRGAGTAANYTGGSCAVRGAGTEYFFPQNRL